nr:LHCII kinase, 64 kda kinase [spinach, Peptide Chloroplast Partial, 15 aa] [Spinacia oleracea]
APILPDVEKSTLSDA